MARTVCIERGTNRELATYPYPMKVLQVGNEFYVGQQRHVIVEVSTPDDLNSPEAEVVVTLKRSNP